MTKHLGYCTNVHAGADLSEMQANLTEHTLRVRQLFAPNALMGVGLWFSACAAEELLQGDGQLAAFRDWLAVHGLIPFTFNGFPYGDFHQDVVKHRVYQPTWASRERGEYTRNLVRIMDQLLPAGMPGTISTLPIAWRDAENLADARQELRSMAVFLEQWQVETSRQIRLCIEPEPGCELQTSDDVVRLFEGHLFVGDSEAAAREHLTVCHDVCHAAVMFESQSHAFDVYRKAGISIGKVQISSAIEVPFVSLNAGERQEALDQVRLFAEDRYLHQTVRRNESRGTTTFSDDLPLAISQADPDDLADETWRIHFHVPLFLKEFGLLRSTQADTIECCKILAGDESIRHLEVETYAWNVLPEAIRGASLADGIAQELQWAALQLERV